MKKQENEVRKKGKKKK